MGRSNIFLRGAVKKNSLGGSNKFSKKTTKKHIYFFSFLGGTKIIFRGNKTKKNLGKGSNNLVSHFFSGCSKISFWGGQTNSVWGGSNKLDLFSSSFSGRKHFFLVGFQFFSFLRGWEVHKIEEKNFFFWGGGV